MFLSLFLALSSSADDAPFPPRNKFSRLRHEPNARARARIGVPRFRSLLTRFYESKVAGQGGARLLASADGRAAGPVRSIWSYIGAQPMLIGVIAVTLVMVLVAFASLTCRGQRDVPDVSPLLHPEDQLGH
jgi:hypothetical protein